MPHLSPIIWTGLYVVIWVVYFFMVVSLEFSCKSLNR